MHLYNMLERELRDWGFWPNRFSYNPREKYAVITLYQSETDWALSRTLLTYVIKLILDNWKVDISLRDQLEREVIKNSALRLAYFLELPPLHGPLGPYDWINKDFAIQLPLATEVA